MSITALPVELIRAIALPLDKNDILSVLPVHRSFAPFRPYLFRSVKLHISASWFHEDRDEFNAAEAEKYTRDCFFRTLDQFPNFAYSISSLHLIIDPQSLITSETRRHGKFDLTTRTIELLEACINLKELHLERPAGTGAGVIPLSILDAVPTTVKILRITQTPLCSLGVSRLLSRLTSLAELDLRASYPIETLGTRLQPSTSLARIRLPGHDLNLYPFLADILDASPNLVSLDGPPGGLKMVSRSPHPRLKRLGASGKSRDRGDGCLDAIVKVLESSRGLEELDTLIATGEAVCYRFDASNDVIQALPSGIKSLTLTGESTFSPASLITALESGTWSSLSTLKITRFGHVSPMLRSQSEAENLERVEELCRAGGVELKWADIWGRAKNSVNHF